MKYQTLRLRGIDFPVAFNASGARGFFGDGKEYWYQKFYRFLGLMWFWSTFVAKTTTLNANKGNMPLKPDGYSPSDRVPECIHVRQAWRGRLLNAVGLSGPGLEALLKAKKWQNRKTSFFISIMAIGKTRGERYFEYSNFIEKLAVAKKDFKAPFGIQVNISCPNTGHDVKELTGEVKDILDLFDAEDDLDGVPVLMKVNVFFPTEIAAALSMHPRLDGWVTSNSIPWKDLPDLGIDRKRIFGSDTSPLEKYGGGGYSGPEMRLHVKTWIRLVRRRGVSKAIIAENGIRTPWHAVEMIEAGASAIGIGSMAICYPFFALFTFLAAHWAVERKRKRDAERNVTRLVLHTPDDLHVHLRDDYMLKLVLPYTASVFGRYLVMPNKPAIRKASDMIAYRKEIMRLNRWRGSLPLMTMLLGPKTTLQDVVEAADAGAIAFKLYPDGVTTGSEGGVRDFKALWPVIGLISKSWTRPLPHMLQCRMALCLHGEMPGVYCIQREIAFLKVVDDILKDFPGMPVTLEHITTKEAVEFVRSRAKAGHKIAASITVHHLSLTLDDVIGSKVKVHNHCQPCAKGPEDREALLQAATSGEPWFFHGSDSAPHAKADKECAEGCAGAFTAPAAPGTLVEIFEARRALDKLDGYYSLNGARHYNLPPNRGELIMEKRPWRVPDQIMHVVPWRAGERIEWQVAKGNKLFTWRQRWRRRKL